MAVKRLYAFRISDELREALRRLKARDGMPASEAIHRGTVLFLARKGIKVRAPKPAPGRRATKKAKR